MPNGQSSAQRKHKEVRGTRDPSTKFILNEVKGSGQAPGRGKWTMCNAEWTIFRAAELYYPPKRY
jgi:hypothetical protein